MGQVIAMAQEKGGSGKSTLLTMLASRLEKDGISVSILDVDPQKTASTWAEKSIEKGLNLKFASVDLDEQDKIIPYIQGLKKEFDIVLVDTAGIESQSLFFVILNADLVLMPSKASEPDLLGMAKTYKKVMQVSESAGREIKAYAILSDVAKDTNITASVKDAIDGQGIPRLSKIICSRTKLKELITNGGYPEGNAMKEASDLIASLQIEGLLDCYKEKVDG